MTCFFCGETAHPAAGVIYSQRVTACRRCAEGFSEWFREQMVGWVRRRSPEFHAALDHYALTQRRERPGSRTWRPAAAPRIDVDEAPEAWRVFIQAS
jgi:hypothetical protein